MANIYGHSKAPAMMPGKPIATLLVAALISSLLAALAGIRPAEAAFPGDVGRIFFETARDDGRTNIYSINPNGTGATGLPRSSEAVADTNPAVSPDGSRVAYEHADDIWVMNADGTGPRPVTKNGSTTDDLQPAWSPDGTRIAFYRVGTNREIFTVNADGSGLKQLTGSPNEERNPAWSPNGKIAYVVCCPSGENIWVMNADGSGKRNLTGGSGYPGVAGGSTEPNWSHDGTRIVFSAGPDCDFNCRGKDIYVMNSAGGGETNLTPNEENHFQPVFSPNSARIAFTSNTMHGGSFDIFTINTNGGGLVPVTNDAAQDGNPDWQPVPRCTMTVNAANDPLVGTPGKDVLCGDGRDNTMNGAAGNDIVLGQGGDDRLTGGAGNDTVNGGPGTDTALFPGTTAVAASLKTQFAKGAGLDVLLGIENLSGSDAGDRLTGSGVTNTLSGLGGNDVLDVRDGRDGDTVDGGTGTDTCARDAGDTARRCP